VTAVYRLNGQFPAQSPRSSSPACTVTGCPRSWPGSRIPGCLSSWLLIPGMPSWSRSWCHPDRHARRLKAVVISHFR